MLEKWAFYEYDAFGNPVVCEETVKNRFRYTGEQFDPVTGQYYLRARFYSPVIGRFTQEDTFEGDGLNLYSYVRNNPVKYVDPSGHYCEEHYKKLGYTEEEAKILAQRDLDIENGDLTAEMNYRNAVWNLMKQEYSFSDKWYSDDRPRLIPGTPGVVTGGSSTVLGQNLFVEMGKNKSTSRKGNQA